jgi:hypothetical protein
MKGGNVGSRVIALAAGVTFSGGALYILLEDVSKTHQVSMEHGLTVLTLFGTIAVGHLALEAGRQRHLLPLVGFAFLFLAGTALTVYNSVGRQSETTDAKLLDTEARNELISSARRARLANEAMLTEARANHSRECASGRGKRCDGILATIRVYEDAVKGNESDLARLGPPLPVAPKAEKMAAVAAIFGADKAQAKATLMLIEPFAYTLFFELGSIISFGYGFGGRRTDGLLPATSPTPAQLSRVARRNFSDRGPTIVSKRVAERDLRARLETGETVAAQNELVALWGFNKGTVSKWVSEWERNGAIPARRPAGRCKTIAQR